MQMPDSIIIICRFSETEHLLHFSLIKKVIYYIFLLINVHELFLYNFSLQILRGMS